MQIACNQCSGDNYLCSGDTDTGAIEYCWANVTTCSIGKLTDRTNSQVVWGISCGVGEVDVDGTVCQPFQTQTADSGRHLVPGLAPRQSVSGDITNN